MRLSHEETELLAKLADEAEERGEAVIRLGGKVFRAAGHLNAWHMVKLAQAERDGDVMLALSRFGDLVEEAVHEEDRLRLDDHLSSANMGLQEMQQDMASVMMQAAEQAGFGEDEAEDPTGPSAPGRPTPSPTPESSTPDSSSVDSASPSTS